MSLVNDVLRQLDVASAKPYPSMPLNSLMVDKPTKTNNVMNVLFIALVTLLLIILTLQLFYKQSLIDVFYLSEKQTLAVPEKIVIPASNMIVKDSSAVPIENKILAVELVKSRPAMKDVNTNTALSEKQVELIDSSVKEVLAPHPKVAVASKQVSKIKESANKKEMLSRNNEHQAADIRAVENVGFKQYQLALRAYKQKKSVTALSWIDLALAAEIKEEYLRLKVRVLMQKGDGAELQRFILEQSDNTNLTWFQLVAPSLQMYSYYDLSNKYYSELVKQQPNEVKWQLAMALNFSKLGLEEETYSIYKNLLNTSLLTYKQQKWIASRLERMEHGGVVINE